MCECSGKSSSVLTSSRVNVSLVTTETPWTVKNTSIRMAWVTTSMLNGLTKWHGPGHAAYDEAATALGAEVTPWTRRRLFDRPIQQMKKMPAMDGSGSWAYPIKCPPPDR